MEFAFQGFGKILLFSFKFKVTQNLYLWSDFNLFDTTFSL